MKLFGTDGIRGVAGDYPLDSDNVKKIGAAAAVVFAKGTTKRPLIIIGRDTRLSGDGIARALTGALTRGGIDVWDVGVIPTPAVAYLCIKYPVAAGIVISASHNPWQDNGIKFFSHKGTKLPDSLEEKIEKFIFTPKIIPEARPGRKYFKKVLVKEYEQFLAGSLPKGMDLKGLSIVIDCANGSTCAVAGRVMEKLGAKVKAYNTKPDGRNINEECGALHPDKIAKEVLKNKADIGFAFDGDGDRVMPVDQRGIVRDGDYYLAIMSRYMKDRGTLAKNTLVATVMSNLGLLKAMEANDIKVLQTAVGDKSVSEGMARSGGIIGGEQSGHIILKDHLPTGDGILSALQLTAVIKGTGKSLEELSKILTKFPQVLLNEHVSKKVPLEQLPALRAKIAVYEKQLGDNGRVFVRYSGTETMLRVMIEGPDKKQIETMAKDLVAIAKKEIESKK